MKKILPVLLACLMLWGCGAKEAPAPTAGVTAATEAAETTVATGPTVAAEPVETEPIPEHLQLRPKENYNVDAEVFSHGVTSAAPVEMAPLGLTAEQLLSILIPEDTSQRTTENVEFRRIVTTEQGSSLTFTDSHFTAFRGGYEHQDLYEMETLLSGWAEDHPEDAVHPLNFMSPEEALQKAQDVLKQMNVGYEPVVDVFAALTGPEINAYQQVCLDDPMYTEFGKFHMLPELTDAHDAYYLHFSFAFNGIPLSQPGVMSDTYGAVFAPDAAMLITREGIAYFSCLGLQALKSVGEPQTLITPDEAIEAMGKVVQDRFYDQEVYRTSRLELGYLPLCAEGKTTLIPYWGVEVLTSPYPDDLPPQYRPQISYWFNGFTGAYFTDE